MGNHEISTGAAHDCYYDATANAFPTLPSLEGDLSCDVCVIGAGYTGVSAALNLAERGYEVVLLEAESVGWGASGRNGGHVGSGQRKDQADLEGMLGKGDARRLWELGEEAKRIVKDRIAQHGIECDLTPGQLIAARKSSDVQYLKRRVDILQEKYDYRHARWVSEEEVGEIVDSEAFHGGQLDTDAAHLHPLNYVRGLARAAQGAGARIFERSRVQRYTGNSPSTIQTANGNVQARFVVLACNGYLGALEPRVAGKIMPINNFLVATASLGAERAARLIRDRICVHDTLFVVNFFRVSADDRLIFGGGETYSSRFPRDIKGFVAKHMLGIFPKLRDVPIDYGWGGTLAITMNRMPNVGRLDPNVFYAQGYSGHGVSIASLAGQLIAEAVAGTAERFDVMARVPARTFPGGTLLRWPGQVLGMLYYSLRDRL